MSERYARQTILPEVGAAGQARLQGARVLVVGAGGLGCPVIAGLAGAGLGQLVIVDPDVVSESNLHRQPLYDMADLDRPKAVCAAHWVRDRAPDCRVEVHVLRLDPLNARGLLAGVDLVVDAADSYAVSYILSDLCHPAGLPLISASVLGLSGYVGGFCGGAPSYRAVFPDLPADGRSCATAGVLGPVVATLGAMQAQMALAVLLGLSPAPLGRMVTVDLASYRFGGFDFHRAPEPVGGFPFLAAGEVTPADCVIELRPEEEAPRPAVAQALRLLPEALGRWQPPGAGRIVLCCRSGLRAWRAAEALKARGIGPLALLAAGE